MPDVSRTPAISVISANRNHETFIEDAIESVLRQKFDDYEYIIVDGASTDRSVDIIKKYAAKNPCMRWVSEPDSGNAEALRKALNMARGRYIMITTSTDGYLSRNWFSNVAAVLDNDPTVSLVWGNCQSMDEHGSLGQIVWPNLFSNPPPQKEQWCFTWLNALAENLSAYRCPLPELNYCIRADILRKLNGEFSEFPEINNIDMIYKIAFGFGYFGYMPYYLPIVANFGRSHANREQFTPRVREEEKAFYAAYPKYHKMLTSGERLHYIRNGRGEPILQVSLRQG